MTPLRVLALAHDPDGPSARYRIRQFGPALAREGVALEVRALPRGTKDRATLFHELPPHDLVVLSRVLLGAGEVKWLRRGARRLCYDVDDALPFRTTAEGAGRSSRRSARFARLCAAADLVVAGNAYLGDLAAPRAHAVVVVPTAVDVARYPVAPAAGDRLAWIGQPPTAPYLHALAPALATVATRRPATTLRVIGADAPVVPGLEVEARPWSEATEVAALAGSAVGLAPLPDDAWTRGKCGLRLLQYLAAGVPAVASPVGVQAEIVAGGCGRLARTQAEWEDAICALLADPLERAAVAAAGRARVAERYSVSAVLPALLEAWRRAAAR